MECDIGPLAHDCAVRGFRCGVPEIDEWFHSRSIKRHKAYLVRTYTAHRAGNPAPAGFYSLTIGSERWKSLSERDRKSSDGHLFPTVNVHYFAVHRSMQRQGIGRLLMAHALDQACEIARLAGTYAVTLVAIDHGARQFYEKLGFRSYDETDGRPRMMLPIESLLEASDGA